MRAKITETILLKRLLRLDSTQIATGITPTVDLAVGTHTITLTVTDDDGITSTDEVMVTVGEE